VSAPERDADRVRMRISTKGPRHDAKRVHVFYTGRVQGVGFRITVEEIAQTLEVVGWVRNLRDGRVELVAEAPQERLERFLEAVRTGPMKNFIGQIDATWSAATGTFNDFSIRYY